MEIKAALVEARRNQEAQFAKDWQDRLKQLKAEEVREARRLEPMLFVLTPEPCIPKYSLCPEQHIVFIWWFRPSCLSEGVAVCQPFCAKAGNRQPA